MVVVPWDITLLGILEFLVLEAKKGGGHFRVALRNAKSHRKNL